MSTQFLRVLLYSKAIDYKKHILLLSMFCLWLILIITESYAHAVWRDETRALTIAVTSTSFMDLIHRLHTEGHPALWYLILRSAHALIPFPAILKFVSISIAASAAMLLLWRSPFPIWLRCGLLLSQFFSFEYSVMARNYGISILLMFIFSSLYEKHRSRGITLSIILLLMANTNILSAIISILLLIFWLIDNCYTRKINETKPAKIILTINASIVLLGLGLCIASIYPSSYNTTFTHSNLSTSELMNCIFFPGKYFFDIIPPIQAKPALQIIAGSMSLIFSTFILADSPILLILLTASLFAFSCFFSLVYPGSYRHQDIWIAFMITLFWISQNQEKNNRSKKSLLKKIGFISALILLCGQIWTGIAYVHAALDAQTPYSQAKNLSILIAHQSRLHDAIIMAEPDFLIDAIPYYIQNPTYLLREQRFGAYFTPTDKGIHEQMTLGKILAEAKMLMATKHRPVIILLQKQLDQPLSAQSDQDRSGPFPLILSAKDVDTFLRSTIKLASLQASSGCNEGLIGPVRTWACDRFDVYLFPAKQ